MTQPDHKQEWKDRFTREFGTHFTPSELQFALEFIDEHDAACREIYGNPHP